MTSLDLTVAAPRAPRAELAGLTFLPRSIDKVRATLPGGNLGLYTIEGFTEMMLEEIAISLDAFTDAVRTAANDEAIVSFIREHADHHGIERWNTFVLGRVPFAGDREKAVERWPFLAERTEVPLAVDILEEDDARMFAPA